MAAVDTFLLSAIRIASASLAAMMVVGCSARQSRFTSEEIRPLPLHNTAADETVIKGLRDALQTSTDSRPVRILAVHGMLTNKVGYSSHWQDSIALALGLESDGDTSTDIVRGYDVKVRIASVTIDSVRVLPSRLRTTHWVTKSGPPRRLVFYELYWAPVRDTIKDRFLACFEAPNAVAKGVKCSSTGRARRNGDDRAMVNRAIKDRYLVEGFADAAVVLSPLGSVLRDDVKQAVCIITRDIARRDARGKRCGPQDNVADIAKVRDDVRATPFFAITHSLGSFLVLDTYLRAVSGVISATTVTQRDDEIAQATSTRVLFAGATVFMFANQVSLLALSQIGGSCTPTANPDPCPPMDPILGSDKPVGNDAKELPTYVAFNDVNDLLGYELQPYLRNLELTGRVVNVTVRNPGYRMPGFKHPGAAHTRHGDNKAILTAIVEGLRIPAQGR